MIAPVVVILESAQADEGSQGGVSDLFTIRSYITYNA